MIQIETVNAFGRQKYEFLVFVGAPTGLKGSRAQGLKAQGASGAQAAS